ncbi:MAG: imidazolonepropionase [Psychroflexus sp.]
MTSLFFNIKHLLQVRTETPAILKGETMKDLPKIDDAWLLIEHDKIADYGEMSTCPESGFEEKHDLSGQILLPTWVDSHTHLVYAGNREGEFADRIKGLSYQEIAEKGGGILNSAKTLQNTSEDQLLQETETRLKEIMSLGTGAVEIKSGYGLTKDAELKMLKVISKLKDKYKLPIKSTFLAAHALPKEFKDKKSEYIDMVIDEILPEVANQNLADYIDVFCEKGYFDLEDTEKIIEAGKKYGLKAKIHVNQFNAFGGIKVATDHQALSVDHLEELSVNDIVELKKSETIPVALPSCSFFLTIPYTPGRQIIDNGLPLALATDYNPGSSPNGNMNFVVSLACIKMNLTPEEAINAATINAAYAMEVENEVGSITKGKLANFIITEKIPSYHYLPYSFGNNSINQVWISGKPTK